MPQCVNIFSRLNIWGWIASSDRVKYTPRPLKIGTDADNEHAGLVVNYGISNTIVLEIP